jgi:hypothetical protein
MVWGLAQSCDRIKTVYIFFTLLMNHFSSRKLFFFLIFFLFLFLQTISGIFAPVKLTLTPPFFKTQEVQAAGESWYNPTLRTLFL